jgi:hypothetical protein
MIAVLVVRLACAMICARESQSLGILKLTIFSVSILFFIDFTPEIKFLSECDLYTEGNPCQGKNVNKFKWLCLGNILCQEK